MKFKLFILINLLIIFANIAYALPKSFEVWFLSIDKKSELEALINNNPATFKMLAQNKFDCVPMGTGCFHPQLGYIEKENLKAEDKIIKEQDLKVEVKTINAIETNLIECQDGSLFDIFCGKSKSISTKVALEVWIDTSSSLRAIDQNIDESCYRAQLVRKIDESCRNKASFSIFNTSIKELGASSSACLHYGMNNVDRLIDWISNSDAKKLIVITDIDEYTKSFEEFIIRNNGILKGVGIAPLVAKDLLGLGEEVSKICK